MRAQATRESLPVIIILRSLVRNRLSFVGSHAFVGSHVSISVFTSGFGGAMKQIQIAMRGEAPTVLTRLATRAAGLVRQVPGAVDVGLSRIVETILR